MGFLVFYRVFHVYFILFGFISVFAIFSHPQCPFGFKFIRIISNPLYIFYQFLKEFFFQWVFQFFSYYLVFLRLFRIPSVSFGFKFILIISNPLYIFYQFLKEFFFNGFFSFFQSFSCLFHIIQFYFGFSRFFYPFYLIFTPF